VTKCSFGHVTHTDGLVYGKPRKKSENRYTRYTTTNRKAAPRERAAIIMLRNKGYTYNQLASAFERSANYIYKIIRTAMNRGTVAYRDYRANPHIMKMRTCLTRIGTLLFRFKDWTAFIKGEEDKPP
jgi:hypothetical protein